MYWITGNRSILERQYESMTNWCKYVLHTAATRRGDPKLPEEVERFSWNTGFHFGEWLIPSDKKGISQREACEGSAYYIAPIFGYLSIRIMAEVARILEKPDAEYYADTAQQMKGAIQKALIRDGQLISDHMGAYVLMLALDLVPEKLTERFGQILVSLLEKNHGCLDTGFLATPFLLDAFTKIGRRDLAISLLFQTRQPSWLYEVEQGATAIWETWDAILPDMFMKCRYMDEITGGRGVIFATGTPVSNSMTELYTVMRYLQYGTLQKKNLTHFDSWASTFGETTTAIELAPEGTGYRARTRFAKFFNLPELMNMFKEVADIKTSDQLHLPVPEAKFETVVVQPSEYQKDMVASLSERAADVHAGMIDPSVDNMLKITSDGRKLGLDQRLMNPLLPDDPNSKLNACVGNILRIWQDGQADRLTQLVFCDLSTPKNDGTFNVYDDIKTKLMANGVPAEEVAFIHDADTEAKKKELFAKVRTGKVRVLLGSTQKMGAGTNVQDKLVAVHHLDVGWRPSDMTQRNGRIIRQGNQNKEVQVYQYVTEGTFDAYLYGWLFLLERM